MVQPLCKESKAFAALQMFHKHMPHILGITNGPFLHELHVDTNALNSNDLCRIELGLFSPCLLGINSAASSLGRELYNLCGVIIRSL